MADTAPIVSTPQSAKPDAKPLRVGLDIGSTTVKAVVLDQSDTLSETLFSDYRRHHANVRATVAGLLADIHTMLEEQGRGDEPIRLAIPVPAVSRSPTACTCRSCRRSSPKPKPSTRNTRRPM